MACRYHCFIECDWTWPNAFSQKGDILLYVSSCEGWFEVHWTHTYGDQKHILSSPYFQ